MRGSIIQQPDHLLFFSTKVKQKRKQVSGEKNLKKAKQKKKMSAMDTTKQENIETYIAHRAEQNSNFVTQRLNFSTNKEHQ